MEQGINFYLSQGQPDGSWRNTCKNRKATIPRPEFTLVSLRFSAETKKILDTLPPVLKKISKEKPSSERTMNEIGDENSKLSGGSHRDDGASAIFINSP
jgi:hypothetical protein